MAARNKATDFLRAMNPDAAEEPAPSPATPLPAPPKAAARGSAVAKTTGKAATAKPASRQGLKHFGGYLDDDTLEKIALLRIRLKKDNSELIKFAIEELHRKHMAKRAFGDA